jgi:hypothetical protein
MSSGFTRQQIEAIDAAKIAGVRAGDEHRPTAVWVVLVENRPFVRSWNDSPTGWYRAFLAERRGSLFVGDLEIAVRSRRTRSERLLKAVSAALAAKYATPGSQKWVRGFAEPEREACTLELTPRP